MEALFAAIDATTSASGTWDSSLAANLAEFSDSHAEPDQSQKAQLHSTNTTENIITENSRPSVQYGDDTEHHQDDALAKLDAPLISTASGADKIHVLKRHPAVIQAVQCEKVEDSASDEDDITKTDVYHSQRALARVKVPPLDRNSAKALPAALRQLADHNPRGDLEHTATLSPRRKRKAVQHPDFISSVQRPRNAGVLQLKKKQQKVRERDVCDTAVEAPSSPQSPVLSPSYALAENDRTNCFQEKKPRASRVLIKEHRNSDIVTTLPSSKNTGSASADNESKTLIPQSDDSSEKKLVDGDQTFTSIPADAHVPILPSTMPSTTRGTVSRPDTKRRALSESDSVLSSASSHAQNQSTTDGPATLRSNEHPSDAAAADKSPVVTNTPPLPAGKSAGASSSDCSPPAPYSAGGDNAATRQNPGRARKKPTSSRSVPSALRCLMDFNGRGSLEQTPLRSRRARSAAADDERGRSRSSRSATPSCPKKTQPARTGEEDTNRSRANRVVSRKQERATHLTARHPSKQTVAPKQSRLRGRTTEQAPITRATHGTAKAAAERSSLPTHDASTVTGPVATAAPVPSPPAAAKNFVSALPLALRRLMDFNSTGLTESAARVVSDTAFRKARVKHDPTTTASGVAKAKAAGPIHNDGGGGEALTAHSRSPSTPRARTGKRSRQHVPTAAVETGATCYESPFVGEPGGMNTAEAPSHKVWLFMGETQHRRFRKTMGSDYHYKQHVPTPEYLRQRHYKFRISVQNEGELVCTAGDSHCVISGNSRGFSWSHLDPATLQRLERSDKLHGSRQADGKPNTFSGHFHRSSALMTKLKNTINECPYWQQTQKQIQKHVQATKTDSEYHARRQAEGWKAAEINPLYLPTAAQLKDPYWFTALMMGPGATGGSLHIKFPDSWTHDPERNCGHVPWTLRSTRVWKLEAVARQGRGIQADKDVVDVRVIRPESKGIEALSDIVRTARSIHVPTSPTELTTFINQLPEMSQHVPIFYSPQVPVSDAQLACLRKILPSWALPLSEIDGMNSMFNFPAEGTTTPSGFGGRFGVTGLHDEYNHTVSMFIYPRWEPLPRQQDKRGATTAVGHTLSSKRRRTTRST
eukprot:m.712184 g.712184  ORF g.712184 m.712184 type:complete len:1101 (-) comp22959_c0_seq4:1710-5012(-)